ncbi:family 2 glycosyl transferase [Stenotrophomonas maltophilia]|uniref:glycosyltransferase family 2 protein n=1 Tax=Stenotrophomonas TaxID=40323 RepID=UPI000C16174D|nr:MULTISPECIES: glycosyltransferase family 2 protein [Stenotrophomonas]ELK6803681.1 glycosyltransferase family 2 protein [Stenotrophomonas maltophilia]MCU1137501.1 glycosyltransferase family 2 protein [Stenotrophomonas maltophilia]MCV0220696.1 glycosyltransferase family 2 protein [Stenotrophomonas sp. Ps181]MDW7601432.1 glycosyltransferase family 2 protein [Stenotrophomonas maltophilia]PZS80487.1 family 2 glycosyl transferase [Stenotrophomonas maltophilia]
MNPVIPQGPGPGPAFDASLVCAVIVTYGPEPDLLRRVVDSVLQQVGHLVVFDNGSTGVDVDELLAGREGISVVASAHNVGLGSALNRAYERAQALGFAYVLLMDQDSVLAPKMVDVLGTALIELNRAERVAAVGPQFRDSRSGMLAPFVRFGFPFNHKLRGGAGQRISCDFLITSGSLVPMSALQDIGAMDEDLFIDNLDMDWCFRAKRQGYSLYGICDAQMTHSIGEELLPSRTKPDGVIVHKPFRLYFIMRNRVLLYGRAYTPRVWIAQDVPRLLLKLAGNGLFLAPRWIRLRFMLRGLWDGLRGKAGPLPPVNR